MNNKSTLITIAVAVLVIIVGFAFMSGAFKSKSSKSGDRAIHQVPSLTDAEKADADKKAKEVVVNPLIDTGSGESVVEKAANECEKYEKAADKASCYQSQERDLMYTFASLSECSALKYAKQDCEDYFYYKSAENEKDPKYCQMIKEAKVAAACADKVGYLAAVAKTDAAYCEPIKNLSLKNQCVVAVKTAAEQNAKVVAEESAFKKAATQGDTAACSALVDPLKVASCIEPAVTANLDITLCSKLLPKKEDADVCYKKLSYDYDRMVIRRALTDKNPAICDKAYDATIRSQCKQMKFQ